MTSANSSTGTGGSPTGPLENSHTGIAESTSRCSWTRSCAAGSQRPMYTALPITAAS